MSKKKKQEILCEEDRQNKIKANEARTKEMEKEIKQKEEVVFKETGISPRELHKTTMFKDQLTSLMFFEKTYYAALVGYRDGDNKQLKDCYRTVVKSLNELEPADPIEGMLISRLITLHLQGMHALGCVNWNESRESKDGFANRATKLFRLYRS